MNKFKQKSFFNIEHKVKKDFQSDLVNSNTKLSELEKAIPDVGIGKDLKCFLNSYREAKKNNKHIILMMGAHSIKCGLSPLIRDMITHNMVSHIAMNGACVIHDVEMSLFGETSENVQKGIGCGEFGVAKETAEFINSCITSDEHRNKGYGSSMGEELDKQAAQGSILRTAYSYDKIITIHSVPGAEVNHQHPGFFTQKYGKCYGDKMHRDTMKFMSSVCKLTEGSIVMNIGSAVLMPEIFLKSLNYARNRYGRAHGIVTAVFDMLKQYRAEQNVQIRPTYDSGKGYYFVGNFEYMLPLVFGCLL